MASLYDICLACVRLISFIFRHWYRGVKKVAIILIHRYDCCGEKNFHTIAKIVTQVSQISMLDI